MNNHFKVHEIPSLQFGAFRLKEMSYITNKYTIINWNYFHFKKDTGDRMDLV